MDEALRVGRLPQPELSEAQQKALKYTKMANLLLLRANPLESVKAYDSIETVFLHGRPIVRATSLIGLLFSTVTRHSGKIWQRGDAVTPLSGLD